ncbi:FAS1 domain-containing protein [Aaosphaeria arxii CBS 175.79]|uniref:FAS1 domain-containing protein n=1 Tax=Aaosphaeria arxii CBS 175.79 TaxID=1450172 RepID=A0A6A5Y4M0_9PLEO|nr:FAS1 domain-containing protein [Aaosphaeria arxii CBS 175.79]KAF2019740.1 FAS1 domain-containing protein [Aaosphaeria arxii CBS 175.79]
MQFKHLSLLALASYVAAQENNQTVQDLNATLTGQENLSNLTTFLSADPQLLATLSNATNITILAPSNDAFNKLAESPAFQELAGDPAAVAALLTYHVLNGTIPASAITNTSTFVPTLLTDEKFTNVTGGQVVEALVVGNETVFYSGLLQNATVSQADVNFTGGVIHIIDSVLTLPLDLLDTANAANLTAVRGAINATDLIDVVNYTPDVTIFAPTNEAFQSIGSAFENATDILGSVLAYHLINGTVGYSNTLENGTSLQTANGANLTITIDGNGTVFVNSARVVVPNVLIANGVVHIIDEVLNPNNTNTPEPSATEGVPAFSGTPVSEVPFISGQPTPTTQINPTGEGPGPASTNAGETSSSTGAAMPMKTGAVGAAALFGAVGAVMAGM